METLVIRRQKTRQTTDNEDLGEIVENFSSLPYNQLCEDEPTFLPGHVQRLAQILKEYEECEEPKVLHIAELCRILLPFFAYNTEPLS